MVKRNKASHAARASYASLSDGPAGSINAANLSACTEDARRAALDGDTGPPNPNDYAKLLGRLVAVREKLPPLYIDAVFDPFFTTLKGLGESGFVEILLSDPGREGTAGLMLDIAQAVLQHGEGFDRVATGAYQEVISDLYDGFLSAEDRHGIKPPDRETIPPLVKWGNPLFGPYTWPVDATAAGFGLKTAIVNLPPANARHGLLAWAALAHETAGHDILHANTGLMQELVTKLDALFDAQHLPTRLRDYWTSRIDESASDVLGILNMGPAAAVGLIGYFRGLNAAYGGGARLRSDGPADDPHPADILRGYLAAATVRLLDFDLADDWAAYLERETDHDVTTIRIEGKTLSRDEARRSAQVVAEGVVRAKLETLRLHALGEIQNWDNAAETTANSLREYLSTAGELPSLFAAGTYAAHAVAAAVMEALSADGIIDLVFDRMIAMLKIMHDRNPPWGPLYVAHPGNIARIRSYQPSARVQAAALPAGSETNGARGRRGGILQKAHAQAD